LSRHVSNWESAFPHEADIDHRGAHRRLACARRALSQGQFYRVRLDQCVSLNSPLARPYLGAWSSQKNRAEGEAIDTANLGEEIETSPEDGPPATSDPLTADPPPDEVDEAAWLMIPLLRAAEARWAAVVSPLRDETPPPDPWPWLSVYGLGKRPQQ
jgi:hypothetical protein